MVFVTTAQLFSDNVNSSTDDTHIHGYGFFPRKLYLWILKFEFYVIFTSQNTVLLYFSPNLSNLEPYLAHRAFIKRGNERDLTQGL